MSSRESFRREAIEWVERFDACADGMAAKSRELVLQLLQHSTDPFSREQFTPGHITCTALVLHPGGSEGPRSDLDRVLLMFHHRLERWLLPGGHVEASDLHLADAAAREAREETLIEIEEGASPVLAGIDVHGIPPRKGEPFHLHHDLIWAFRAAKAHIEVTPEAPSVMWARETDFDALGVAQSIRNAFEIARKSAL